VNFGIWAAALLAAIVFIRQVRVPAAEEAPAPLPG
jgi:hypothetical protein